MGFIDAFVYAHHQQRRSIENPGNLGDSMKGRFLFMTAITPAYAHAYQATCLTRHMPSIPHQNFRLPKPKARYPHLSSLRTTTRERGNDFRGWAIYTDGGTRVVNGETFAGWSIIARSHHGRIDIMFGPVITTEAHLAFSGARTHSNNTAEMSSMIEALSFLGPRGPSACDVESCIIMTLNTLLVCAWARFRPQHMSNWRLHVSGQCYAPNTGYGLPRNTCTDTNLGNECADHAAALGSLGLISSHNVATRWVRHNFDTSACRGWNSISEMLERLRRIGTEATSLPQDGN